MMMANSLGFSVVWRESKAEIVKTPVDGKEVLLTIGA
jgi:hypothetical protein